MDSRVRLRYGVASCAALLLIWALYDYGAFLSPSKHLVAAGFPALGLLWAVFHRCVSGRRTTVGAALRLPTPAGWLLFALAAFALLSMLWSLDPAGSLEAGGILFGGFFFLILGARLSGSSHAERRAALLIMVTVGFVLSLLAIAGLAFRYWRFATMHDGALLATSTLGYANAFAGLLLLTLAATVAVFLDTRNNRPVTMSGPRRVAPPLLVAVALVQLAALVLTRSRAAGAVLAVLILFALIMWSFGPADGARRHVQLGVVLTVLLLSGLAAGSVLIWKEVAPQMAVSGLPPADADPTDIVPMTSNAFRIKNWAAALEATRERPVAGYGLGTFFEAYAPFKQGGQTAYAHNVFVQQLVEGGALGTLLLLGFLAAALLRPLRILLGPATDPRFPLLLGALAFFLHNLVDLTWYFPALFFIFALLVGLIGPRGCGSPADQAGVLTH